MSRLVIAGVGLAVVVAAIGFVVVGRRPPSRDVEVIVSDRIEGDYPPLVVIDAQTSNPVETLIGALNSRNREQTVEICRDLDLTGRSLIRTDKDHRSLVAGEGCKRTPDRPGPRLYVRDERDHSHPLFIFRGDHIRISGFRLEGPTSDIGADEDNEEIGIKIWPQVPAEGDVAPVQQVEISNMEMYYWSGAAVYIADQKVAERAPQGRLLKTTVGAVRVTDSYLHHNRHDHGDGYGVEVTGGGYALIDRNVFHENRHAIAGGSHSKPDGGGPNELDYSGYTARANLILNSGGSHCRGYIFCRRTHQIDMHGDKDDFWNGEHCCGTAGETILIERNTILYTLGYAIKIRGNPTDTAVVDGNVFEHRYSHDAIDQNGEPGEDPTNRIHIRPNNIFNTDAPDVHGSCDFSGDGTPDLFLATGVTWWAFSAATRQWWYLNTMPERLSQVRLADADRDGICDVILNGSQPERYSKGGRTPWQSDMPDIHP